MAPADPDANIKSSGTSGTLRIKPAYQWTLSKKSAA